MCIGGRLSCHLDLVKWDGSAEIESPLQYNAGERVGSHKQIVKEDPKDEHTKFDTKAVHLTSSCSHRMSQSVIDLLGRYIRNEEPIVAAAVENVRTDCVPLAHSFGKWPKRASRTRNILKYDAFIFIMTRNHFQ